MDENDRKKNISLLVEEYYKNHQEVQHIPFKFLEKKAFELFLNSKYNIKDISNFINLGALFNKNIIDKATDESYHDKGIINTLLKAIIPLLNQEGIDYQISGKLAFVLKYNIKYDKKINNIDFRINEKDIGKFKHVCSTLGLKYQDRRLEPTKILSNTYFDNDDVIASSNNDNLILATCFERLLDGTVIDKNYYHDKKDNACCRERIIDKKIAKSIFGEEHVDFNDQVIPIISPIYLYLISKKDDFLKKDEYDEFNSYLSLEELNQMRDNLKYNLYIQNTKVSSLPKISKINTKSIKNDNTEISQMLTGININTSDNKYNNKKKKDDVMLSSKSGKIDNYTIIIISLIFVAIVLLGMIIYLMINK